MTLDRVIDLTTAEDTDESLVVDRPPLVQTEINALRHYRLIGFALALIDILCLTTALLAAHALRFGSLPGRDYLIGMVVCRGSVGRCLPRARPVRAAAPAPRRGGASNDQRRR